MHAVDLIGSGQKTATGIDPRIETGLPKNESTHAESGSDPKIAKLAGGQRPRGLPPSTA